MARPSIAPELRKLPKGVSLTQAEWDKFQALGGSRWLARTLARARVPAPTPIPERKKA